MAKNSARQMIQSITENHRSVFSLPGKNVNREKTKANNSITIIGLDKCAFMISILDIGFWILDFGLGSFNSSFINHRKEGKYGLCHIY